jgi:alanine racemase
VARSSPSEANGRPGGSGKLLTFPDLISSEAASRPRFPSRPTRAVVDLDAIARNYRLLRDRVKARAVYPVLKADAYGHGAVPVARRLQSEGADRYAVAIAEEGVALRRAGIVGEILILGAVYASDFSILRGYGLVPALADLDQARAFAERCRSGRTRMRVQVKLDSGMGRLGFRPESVDALAEVLRGAPGLEVAGVFTQLACGKDPEPEPTRGHLATLRHGVDVLRDAGILPASVHAASSGALLTHAESLLDAVRPGLALYGVLPSEELPDPGLSPALSLETEVLSAKNVPAGTPLGYGGAFVTSRPSRIAVLPIGYHDGYRRSFTGRAAVLLRGARAPVVGWVSMDLTLIDATETGAEPGDRVVLIGSSGAERITAWELARLGDTNPYELLSAIGARVVRVYEPPGTAA